MIHYCRIYYKPTLILFIAPHASIILIILVTTHYRPLIKPLLILLLKQKMVSKILMRRLLVDRIRLFLLEEIALSSLLMLVYLTLNDISTRSIINLCLSVLNISIGYDSGLARWSIYLLLPSFTSDIIIQANILR